MGHHEESVSCIEGSGRGNRREHRSGADEQGRAHRVAGQTLDCVQGRPSIVERDLKRSDPAVEKRVRNGLELRV